MREFANLKIVDHPLVQSWLAEMRAATTGMRAFRQAMDVIAPLLFFEASRDLHTAPVSLVTPVGPAIGRTIDQDSIVLVPILRAGMGMLVPITSICPHARIGTIGVMRNEETLQPYCYHRKLPPLQRHAVVFVLDPMLATGGTSGTAVEALRAHGYHDIRLVSVVAAPEGVQAVNDSYPSVPITAAALDERLNDVGYIVPGLGDAGDRLFGTQ